MEDETKSKGVDPYFPDVEPDILTFLTSQLLKSLEREDYLYRRLHEAGVLGERDIDMLNGLADWQRIPTMNSPIRDKAIDRLNQVLKDMTVGGTNGRQGD